MASRQPLNTMVNLRCGNENGPAFRVVESVDSRGEDQLQIIFRAGSREEHVSLHANPSGSGLPVVTWFAPEIASSTWDEERVSAAEGAGWARPERHAGYIRHHEILPRVVGMNGVHLAGRMTDLRKAKVKPKYATLPSIEVDVPATECMIDIILSTDVQPFEPAELPHVETSFGNLYFLPQPSTQASDEAESATSSEA